MADSAKIITRQIAPAAQGPELSDALATAGGPWALWRDHGGRGRRGTLLGLRIRNVGMGAIAWPPEIIPTSAAAGCAASCSPWWSTCRGRPTAWSGRFRSGLVDHAQSQCGACLSGGRKVADGIRQVVLWLGADSAGPGDPDGRRSSKWSLRPVMSLLRQSRA